MTLAASFLSRLGRLGEAGAVPRVRALHLPPPGAGGREGEFCALELDDGSVGLSFVLLGDTLPRLREASPGAALAGADALAVARRYGGSGPLDRALGFAAVHALTACLFRLAGYAPEGAGDSLGLLDPRPGDRVGMVGLFPSLVERVVRSGARLTVVELRPELAGERDGYRVTLDAAELRSCDKVLTTSTILLNDTADAVLARCSGARILAVVGPGAGCLPDPLFERGATVVGGTRIADPAAFLAALASGSRWGDAARKYTLRRDEYPGFEALLARSRARSRERPA